MKINSDFVRLLQGKHLSKPRTHKIFLALFTGGLPEQAVKALLLLLARKGEALDEILGCLTALRKLEPPQPIAVKRLMDTCGTGGDKSGSVNISTLASFVIAGAGGKVAKHGNRGLSSRCGSSDLMEALGVNLAAPKGKIIRAIRKSGLGYFHAPFHHPVFARVQPLRRSLKTRTLFNLMGPLTNPLKLNAQMIGVSCRQDVHRFANILSRTGIKNAFVFCSADGMDEISSRAPAFLGRIKNRQIKYLTFNPKSLGFDKAPERAYCGGSVSKNKQIALALLRGKLSGPVRDIVILNAAAGLILAGKANSFPEGIRLADHSLASGKAYQALENLRRDTRR